MQLFARRTVEVGPKPSCMGGVVGVGVWGLGWGGAPPPAPPPPCTPPPVGKPLSFTENSIPAWIG